MKSFDYSDDKTRWADVWKTNMKKLALATIIIIIIIKCEEEKKKLKFEIQFNENKKKTYQKYFLSVFFVVKIIITLRWLVDWFGKKPNHN